MNPNRDQLLKFVFTDDQTIQNFKKLKKTEDKISKIWGTPFFQNFLRKESELKYNKSEGDSKRFREAGNKYYMAGKDIEAIKFFNKAILKAPQNREGKGRDYSLALANRSASLLRLGYFRLCLLQVELALAAGYPRELRYKLIERKIILSQYQEEDLGELKEEYIRSVNESKLPEDKKELHIRDIENFKPKDLPEDKGLEDVVLSHSLTEVHPHLPSFSSQIDIKYEKNRGRFAVANCAIPVGSVILVEAPYASIVKDSEERVERCDSCMKDVHLCCIPCRDCANVRFCSLQCRDEASEGYHKYECGMQDIYGNILAKISPNSGDTNEYSRLALRAITQHPLSWHRNQREVKEKINVTSTDLSSSHGVWNLVSHQEKLSDTRLWWFLISALCNLRSLQLSGFFGKTKSSLSPTLTESEVMVGGMLVDLLLSLQFNTHSVTESSDLLKTSKRFNHFENRVRVIGTAVYPTFALVNHSCNQNTYKYFAGNNLIVVSSKNILPGEEVTENYFPVSQVIPRAERRSWLSQHYWFDCLCSACQENIPTVEDISTNCTKVVCSLQGCPGILNPPGKCSACGSQTEDLQLRTQEIIKIGRQLEQLRSSLESAKNTESTMKDFQEVTELWGRMDSMVKHPYRGLYLGEQVFWKALRMTFGNKAKDL